MMRKPLLAEGTERYQGSAGRVMSNPYRGLHLELAAESFTH